MADPQNKPRLRLRPATPDDARVVFAWANDPGSREASFTTTTIAWDEHRAWFEAQLERRDRNPLLATLDAKPVAFVRLDARPGAPDECTISINVAPAARGRGLGVASLKAATRQAARLGFARIHALIRPENAASRRAFARAGYVPAGDAAVAGQAAIVMICETAESR